MKEGKEILIEDGYSSVFHYTPGTRVMRPLVRGKNMLSEFHWGSKDSSISKCTWWQCKDEDRQRDITYSSFSVTSIGYTVLWLVAMLEITGGPCHCRTFQSQSFGHWSYQPQIFQSLILQFQTLLWLNGWKVWGWYFQCFCLMLLLLRLFCHFFASLLKTNKEYTSMYISGIPFYYLLFEIRYTIALWSTLDSDFPSSNPVSANLFSLFNFLSISWMKIKHCT